MDAEGQEPRLEAKGPAGVDPSGSSLKDGVKAIFDYRTWGLDSLLTQEKERGWKREIQC